MKKMLFFLTLFTAQSYSAQTWHCDDSNVPDPTAPLAVAKAGPIFNPDDYEPVVMNVLFHVVNDDNGNRSLPIGEEEVMNVIRDLNVNFGQFEIYFKYQGFDNINESDYLTLDLSGNPAAPHPQDLHAYGVSNNYHTAHAINIYIVDAIIKNNTQINCAGDLGDVIIPGFMWGSATPSELGTLIQGSLYIMAEYFNTGVTMHEMGHLFNLKHTNQGGCSDSPYSEHVTRDPNAPGYNADISGDWITDTPASPLYYAPGEISDCEYTGPQLDYLGVHYSDELVPVRNFMNVNDLANIYCLDGFTPGQGLRMRHTIAMSMSTDAFTIMTNTVASLYQPFEVMDVPGNTIVSVTPINPTTAMVCRDRLRQHRFQKGFHYTFQNTDVPDAVTGVPNDLPIVKYNTYQFELNIAELSPDFYETIPVICTKGTICNEEPFMGGMLLTTPFLGSPVMELQLLDQEEANDPNLLETLGSKQYHILTRETESGGTVQTIIYKD